MKNLTIIRQLSIGFGLVLLILIATNVFSGIQQSQLAALTDSQYQHPFMVSNAVARVDANTAKIRRDVSELVLFGDDATLAKSIAEIAELDQQIEADLALAKDRFLGDKSDFDALIAAYHQWAPINQKIIDARRAGQVELATQLIQTESAPKSAELIALKKKTYDFAMRKAEGFQKNAAAVRDSALQLTVLMVVLSVALGVAIAYYIARSLTQPIQQAVQVARRVADGHLGGHIEVNGSYETAQLLTALQDMQGSLVQVVHQVRQGSDSVSNASAEIAQGNSDLSARTESQASALQQTAASTEQLSAAVKQNADSARMANQLAMTASSVAVQGGEVVSRVVETMKEINERSQRIADIIGVIDGIAFQTNILALNAAVEAARAGEQGRGFAVVASEVRSLAGRSAEAAREIKVLIHASVEKVAHGSALVDQAGSTMNEVVTSIRRVTDIVGEISAATSDQSNGVTQVGEAVNQMDHATQQNAALVEQMAAAAASLRQQAGDLVQVVSVFNLAEDQGKPPQEHARIGARHSTALAYQGRARGDAVSTQALAAVEASDAMH